MRTESSVRYEAAVLEMLDRQFLPRGFRVVVSAIEIMDGPSIAINDGRWGGASGRSEYRWPLLISVPVWDREVGRRGNWSPALDPGDFSSQRMAEVDHCGVEFALGKGGPEFQLVAVAAALVAAVATAGHVHGEVACSVGRRTVLGQGTPAVPLVAGCLARLEADQVQDVFHGDLAAQAVEVDSGHEALLVG